MAEEDAVTVVLWLAYLLLGTGALLALVRLGRGPSLLDRVDGLMFAVVVVAVGRLAVLMLERG